jgi:hypothetical protein
MKIPIYSSLVLLFATAICWAEQAKFTVRVHDETDAVVTNAAVHVGVTVPIKPGWGWGGGREEKWQGNTDTNGLCVVEVRCYGEAAVAVLKEGYYPSSGYSVMFTNLAFGKWQPWNPPVDIKLKRVGDPIPMYAKMFRGERAQRLPEVGKPIGFDLEKGDWVTPYGKGESSDFIFQLDRQLGGMTSDGFRLFDATFRLSFAAPDDGIQSVYAKPGRGSNLRLSRLAPEQGYETNLVRRAYRHSDGSYVERREDQNYFFRVRTKKDDNGNIISALYGKIYGEIDSDLSRTNNTVVFTYYLNPTPNDRNVEFDPTKNLFKNLSSLEDVRAP